MIQQPEQPTQFIPGIYNYCDRWCQRCPLTAKCSFYATLVKEHAPGSTDRANESFWKEFQTVLGQALQVLTQLAREKGLDLESVSIATLLRDDGPPVDKSEHPLLRQAKQYALSVGDWLRTEQALLEAQKKQIQEYLQIGIPSKELARNFRVTRDAVDVIRWYQHQIHAKLKQAIFKEDDTHPAQFHIRDFDGIVKVALIAMDRSIAAWIHLSDVFPDKSDTILTILLQLDRLRKATEKAFPKARRFKRPGFDDGYVEQYETGL